MKIAINEDEVGQGYFIHTDDFSLRILPTFDIDEGLYSRYIDCMVEFKLIQEELKKIYNGES